MTRVVNTTSGARTVENTSQNVNTSRVLEEDLVYEDSPPEVIATTAGDGWHLVYEVRDELRAVPVLCWAQLDDDTMHPVIAPRDGSKVDLAVDASEDSRFRGFIRPPERLDVPWATRADIADLLDRQTITLEEDS